MKVEDLNIKWYPAPDKEYHKEEFTKKQIVLHHTASGGNSKGDMDYLNGDSQGAVNVAFFIDRGGTLWQAFSSKYYAAHLGVPQTTFQKFKINSNSLTLHKHSIAIELDSWGWLEKGGYTTQSGKYIKKEDGKFYSYTGEEVKKEDVTTYPNSFLGKKYYEKYYPKQLETLKKLLTYLTETYKISKQYNCDMWSVSANALSGKNGIYTHISYRESGKWDAHPDLELIKMLKSF